MTIQERARKIRKIIELLDTTADQFELGRCTQRDEQRIDEALIELCKLADDT